ncbi:MAG: polysaccharide biosynthesis/export family protein, partial [Verrucomicrobiota bacterium]
LLAFVFLYGSVDAQQQRIRGGNGIPEPADYWEDLAPVEEPLVSMPVATPVHNYVEPRLTPSRNPSWQTRYTLGPGDVLTFSVFARPDLLRENVPIAPDGTVSYLQAVGVNAMGLTLDELRDAISKELSVYQNNAKVIITPSTVGSKEFSIIGRVRQPGSYPLDRPTSILEALSLAQGVETNTVRGSAFELADFERSFVARNGQKLDVDLAKLYYQGDFSQNAFLEPDDYIYVASSLENEIYVLGAVINPGRYKIPTRLTVAQAIAEAGGFDQYAYRMRVLIISGSIHEPETRLVNMKDILSGRERDVVLTNRDIVFVNERPFEMLERALDSAIFTFLQTVTSEAIELNYDTLVD